MATGPAALAVAALALGSPSYGLDLRVAPDATTLMGTERIAFTNAGPRPIEALWLRTWAYGPGGCAARGIDVAVTGGGRAAGRARGCTALRVRLATSLAPGARTRLQLRLRITVPRREDRFGRAPGIAYYGNAFPLLAVGDGPGPPYTGTGESFVSATASWTARIHLPRGLRAATTGTTLRARPLVARAPRARDFAMVVGRLHARSLQEGSTRITFWTTTSTRDAGSVLRDAASALRTYSTAWGDYGARELDLVEARFGMEYPELVMTPRQPFPVAHEVAHQWWWGLVGSDQYAHPWMDESLAQYAAPRVPGTQGPAGCAMPADGAAGRSMAFWEGRRAAYSATVYAGGACAWRDLERAWGREHLDAALRAYVAAHRYGIAEPADLLAVLKDAPPQALSELRDAFGF